MWKFDKNEVISVFIILFFLCFLLCGCSSRKKAVKEETNTQERVEKKTMAEDSAIIDYFTDTTKIDAMEAYFEKVEYFPADSVKGEQGAIKAVTRATIHRNRENKGETATHAAKVSIKKDSVKTETAATTKQETKRDTKKLFPYWWILVIIGIITAYCIYKRGN